MARYTEGNPFTQQKSGGYSAGNPFDTEATDVRGGPSGVKTENSRDLNTIPERMLRGALDPVFGTTQLLGKTIEKMTGDKPQWADESEARYAEAQKDYPTPEGFDAARMAGTMFNPATWANPGSKLTAASKVADIARMGLTGGLQSTLMPVDPEADYWETQKERAKLGATLGAGMTTAAHTGGKVYDFGRSQVGDVEGGVTKHLQKTFGDKADDVANELRGYSPKIAGEQPTTGMVGVENSGKYPELISLEKQARGRLEAGDFNLRDAQNKEAALRQFDDMIGGGAKKYDSSGKSINTDFEDAVAAEVGPMYDAAGKEIVHIPDTITDALRGPEAIKASLTGEDILTQEMLNTKAFGNGRTNRGHIPGKDVKGSVSIEEPGMPTLTHDTSIASTLPTESIGSLQNKRKAIDKTIRQGRNAIDPSDIQATEELLKTRRGLTDWMKGSSDEFKNAEETFVEKITPQNRADYVNQLKKAYDQNAGQNPVAFLNALDDATGTARKAGLPIQIDSTTHAMRPGVEGGQEAIDKIDALRNMAQRDISLSQSMGNKVEGVETLGQQIDKYTPPLLSPTVTGFKRLMKTIGGKQAGKMEAMLDKATLDPKVMADFIQGIHPNQRETVMSIFRDTFDKYGKNVGGSVRLEQSRNIEE